MRHYKIGDGPNGKLFVSTHQIPDLSIANTSIFEWAPEILSFTTVVMIIGICALQNHLKAVLLLRCEKFRDVVSIAVLVQLTKTKTTVAHKSDVGTSKEHTPADIIRFVVCYLFRLFVVSFLCFEIFSFQLGICYFSFVSVLLIDT